MNPYTILGVEKDATAADIKKAYWKLSKEQHPDKGGAEDDFKNLSRAYEVLSDPDHRAEFDKTGIWEDEPSLTPPEMVLLNIYSQLLKEHISGARIDFKAQIRNRLHTQLDSSTDAIGASDDALAKLKAHRERTASAKGRNILLIQQKALQGQLESNRAVAQRNIQNIQAALLLVDDFDFGADSLLITSPIMRFASEHGAQMGGGNYGRFGFLT